jgi:hypothetical protein
MQNRKNNISEEINEAGVQFVGDGFGLPKTEFILPGTPISKGSIVDMSIL